MLGVDGWLYRGSQEYYSQDTLRVEIAGWRKMRELASERGRAGEGMTTVETYILLHAIVLYGWG